MPRIQRGKDLRVEPARQKGGGENLSNDMHYEGINGGHSPEKLNPCSLKGLVTQFNILKGVGGRHRKTLKADRGARIYCASEAEKELFNPNREKD